MIAAKVLPGVEVTVGSDQEEGGKWPYAGTAGAIEKMGAKHVKKQVTISFLKKSIRFYKKKYTMYMIICKQMLMSASAMYMHMSLSYLINKDEHDEKPISQSSTTCAEAHLSSFHHYFLEQSALKTCLLTL